MTIRPKYDEVQQKRRENQQVEPYDLRFVKENGDEVLAWIVSAPVPSVSGGMLGALPETFGIFLKTRPSVHKVIQMPPRSADQDCGIENCAGCPFPRRKG